MSVLQRYRKRGGFQQLLKLIETSAPKKRESLLGVIENEDPKWAKDIRQRCLSFEKFCSWTPDTQLSIFNRLNEQYRNVLYKRLPQEVIENMRALLTAPERAKMNDDIANTKEPIEGEYLAALSHLFEMIRSLNDDRVIVLSQIDPSLALPDAA